MPNYLKGIIKNRFGPLLLPLTLLNETVHSTQVYILTILTSCYFESSRGTVGLLVWGCSRSAVEQCYCRRKLVYMVVVFCVERRREFLSF